MKCRSLLVTTVLLFCADLAQSAADRCNPLLLTLANQTLQISPADAPADLVMRARSARLLPLSGATPRLNGSALAEDLALGNPNLGFGDLVDDAAELSSNQADATLIATLGNQRYRLRLTQGVLRDGRGNELRIRPAFATAMPMVVKRGAPVSSAADGSWSAGPGAQIEWVASSQQPLRLVLRDAALLGEAAADTPEAALELASGRIAPGATVPLLVRGSGPSLSNAKFRLCLSGSDGRTVDLETKRVEEENGRVQLTATLPGQLVDKLSVAPTPWQRIWGEPVQLRLLAWADGHPALELRSDMLLTRPTYGIIFGLLVLLAVYAFAALFAGVFRPLALFGQLIKHGKTGRYSLTSFQTLSWTLLVIFALCYSWYCSGVLLELRPDVLQLLGIVGGAHVLTRAVEAATPAADGAQSARKVDLVTDADTGEFDILRFQMLAFTLFSLCYVAFNLLRSHGLPELPQSLYWLMGLGNVAHVAGKLPQAMNASTNAATGTLNAFEAGLGADRIRALQVALSTAQTGVLDAVTRGAIVKYMAANGLYPVGQVSELLLKKLGA